MTRSKDQEKRRVKKIEKKKKERQLTKKPLKPTNQHIHTSNAITVSTLGGKTILQIDATKLVPPEKEYIVDCFKLVISVGYCDFIFGQKQPGNGNNTLLSVVVIRVADQIVKENIIKGHKAYYDVLKKRNSFTEEELNSFDISLPDQFPSDKFRILDGNYLYSAYALGAGELMFYKISASYIHKHVNKADALAPNEGMVGIVNVKVPEPLLFHIYNSIYKLYGA